MHSDLTTLPLRGRVTCLLPQCWSFAEPLHMHSDLTKLPLRGMAIPPSAIS